MKGRAFSICLHIDFELTTKPFSTQRSIFLLLHDEHGAPGGIFLHVEGLNIRVSTAATRKLLRSSMATGPG